ncbi:MAG TPA: sodium:solute symporter [Rhodanobacter sp.]
MRLIFPSNRRRQRGALFSPRAWLFLLLCLVMAPCAAESLTSVKPVALPALPAGAPLDAVAVIDKHVVALRATEAWVLDADRRQWTRSAWRAPAGTEVVLGIAGDGERAFLLRGPAAVDRVQQLVLERGQLVARAAVALPFPLRHARGALQGDALYVAGHTEAGESKLLQLIFRNSAPSWQVLDGWAGDARPVSLVAQTKALFLTVSAGADDDRMWRWSAEAGWEQRGVVPGRIQARSGGALGQAHVLYLVGEEGAPSQLMTFQTITGAWAALPGAEPAATALSAAWSNGMVWSQPSPAGESVTLGAAEIASGNLLLKWLDWIVIVVYLGMMFGMGVYFYLREKRVSTADFFVGGRSIPFWAAGVSLYATNTSSISFIAIPAKAFETNWQYLTNNLIAVVGLMFVAVWIVPLLRRLDLMSVFSYLETRFHPAIRMLASALCIVMQIGSRMSVVLFLPALAIATITGIDVVWSILLMGVVTILYTAMGGMKAVIWTDFVQVIVTMGGALFAIGFIVYQINGGFDEFYAVAMAENKTRLFDFSFDLTKATVWGFIFLVLFDVVLTFPKDQVLMQRTLSTKSDRDAGRSIWAFAAIMIPGGFIFYSIGTALFVYYKSHPERMDPTMSIDATFPLFIAAELPMGVTGLIIAGIFAAAMSTLSSIMNSVATLASVDFYDRLVKKPNPTTSVRFAEAATVVTGLIAIGVALLLSRYDIHSLFDVSIELAGLLGGGFAGAYTLGMFTRRANSPGVAIGVGGSIALTLAAWSIDLVHPYFYLAISIMLCIVIGYAASLFFPKPDRSLDGLTIHTRGDSGHVRASSTS